MFKKILSHPTWQGIAGLIGALSLGVAILQVDWFFNEEKNDQPTVEDVKNKLREIYGTKSVGQSTFSKMERIPCVQADNSVATIVWNYGSETFFVYREDLPMNSPLTCSDICFPKIAEAWQRGDCTKDSMDKVVAKTNIADWTAKEYMEYLERYGKAP